MFMGDGHLMKRVGREFVKNAIWMVVVFGALGAILVAATDLPLVGVTVFVGAFVAVLAAIMTGVAFWSGAHEDTTPVGVIATPGLPPTEAIGPLVAAGIVGEARTAVAAGEGKRASHLYPASRP
jgi:hypothetical protein